MHASVPLAMVVGLITACTDHQVDRLASAVEKAADTFAGIGVNSPAKPLPAAVPALPLFALGSRVSEGGLSIAIPLGWQRLTVDPCPLATVLMAYAVFASDTLVPEATLMVDRGSAEAPSPGCLGVRDGQLGATLQPDAAAVRLATPKGFTLVERFVVQRQGRPDAVLDTFHRPFPEHVVISIERRPGVLSDAQVLAVVGSYAGP